MTAAILCPGPSLSRLLAAPDADLTVGVNRAASRFACTHWAALDWPLIQKQVNQTIGAPVLVTTAESVRYLHSINFDWRGPVVTSESLAHLAPNQLVRWSMVAGILAAVQAGAKTVTVYGADWAGVEDWDGKQAGENRSDQRWRDEAEDFRRLQAHLTGVELTRYGHPL